MLNIILMILCTMIWGFGFIGTKWTLDFYTPLWSNSFRFFIAGIIAIPALYAFKTYRRPRRELIEVACVSVTLFIAMQLQTYGLKYTTVAKSGFITSLYAVFVPIFGIFIYKRKPSMMFWIIMSIAMFGVALLCNLEVSGFNFGDFLTLLCAAFFGLQILGIEYLIKKFSSAVELNGLQCFFMGVIGVVAALVIEGPFSFAPLIANPNPFVPGPILGFIMVGVFSSLVGFGIQAHCQKILSSNIVALILLLESPFAALFAYFVFDETLSLANMVGCGLVIFSVLALPVVESKAWQRRFVRAKKQAA